MPKTAISPLSAIAKHPSMIYPTRFIVIAVAALMLAGFTMTGSGCAANRCDCPKFSGHRLPH